MQPDFESKNNQIKSEKFNHLFGHTI